MEYVQDLELMETVRTMIYSCVKKVITSYSPQHFVQPLRDVAQTPIETDEDPQMLDELIRDIFYNYGSILSLHTELRDALHQVQRTEHPNIVSIAKVVGDVIATCRVAYLDYAFNYPTAVSRLEESLSHPSFQSVRKVRPPLITFMCAWFVSL